MLFIIILGGILGILTMTMVFIKMCKNLDSRILTAEGIQEECYVTLGGTEQYIQIRGEDTRNPVMIFLHGGPGGAMAYMSFYYQRRLEAKFTMVHWDQRGCGRSYFKGNRDEGPTTARLLSDLDELTDYLKGRFHVEKVLIMGFSWGSFLGSMYSKAHPEKVSAYYGISQCVNVWRGNRMTAEQILKKQSIPQKKRERFRKYYDKLKDCKSTKDFSTKDYMITQMYAAKLMPYKGAISGLKTMWLAWTSPLFTRTDWNWYKICISPDKFSYTQRNLMDDCYFGIDLERESKTYQVPMCYICGDSDIVAPMEAAKKYVEQIEAPVKDVYVLKDAGHNLFMEYPEQFCDLVLKWYAKNVENGMPRVSLNRH